jgi:hypothetical protein
MRLRRTLSALIAVSGLTAALLLAGEGGAAASTTSTTSTTTAAALPGTILNYSFTENLPLIKVWKGAFPVYARGNGNYDNWVTPGIRSDKLWPDTNGFYVGYTTRAETWMYNTSTRKWEPHHGAGSGRAPLNRGWYPIGDNDWRVRIYKCGC